MDRRDFLKATVASAVGVRTGQALAAPSTGLVVGQPEGANAGMDVLAAGGNAVDAAVAAALVAGVVAVPSCGIGGYGGHLVIAFPDGKKIVAIDFNSTAPAAARPDMFPLDAKGNVKDQIDSFGWLAAGVPGTLAGLQLALDRYGTLKFGHVVQPAIKFAQDGFAVNKGLATTILAGRGRLQADPGTAALFFVQGQPLPEGAVYRNTQLAGMLERLAQENSVEDFYRGTIAKVIARAFRLRGGLVTVEDLASYQAREVAPLSLDWHGHTVWTAPLTSGGLTVVQALATLKALGWEKRDRSPETTHARIEAIRAAWQDRLRWLGDPEQVDVPVERLLSSRYAGETAERAATAIKERRLIPGSSDGRPAGGTIHLSAADSRGMLVALTLTHGNPFGARVAVPELGLLLGHGMSRFDPRPGQANSIAPRKRPLHNMCPTIVCRQRKPMLALGATGGRRIPNTLFDVLASLIGEKKTLEAAVKAPRLHTEGNASLSLEATWPSADQEYLRSVGYQIQTGPVARLSALELAPTGMKTAVR